MDVHVGFYGQSYPVHSLPRVTERVPLEDGTGHSLEPFTGDELNAIVSIHLWVQTRLVVTGEKEPSELPRCRGTYEELWWILACFEQLRDETLRIEPQELIQEHRHAYNRMAHAGAFSFDDLCSKPGPQAFVDVMFHATPNRTRYNYAQAAGPPRPNIYPVERLPRVPTLYPQAPDHLHDLTAEEQDALRCIIASSSRGS